MVKNAISSSSGQVPPQSARQRRRFAQFGNWHEVVRAAGEVLAAFAAAEEDFLAGEG